MTEVIQLRLKVSNAFLIKEDAAILVDTGSPHDVAAILKAMESAGVKLQDLSLIIHTHAHCDHCGCTAELQRQSGALVAVHRADAQAFGNGKNVPIFPITIMGRMLMPFLKGEYRATEIDVLLEDELDLNPYGVGGKAIATPGHTPGSISVILDNGQAIVGDLVGGGRLVGLLQPSLPRYHHWYSDFDLAQKSILRVMACRPAQVFVGHGGPLDGKAAAKRFCG